MKWIDYRKELGIGFSDNNKAQMLANRLSVLIDILGDSEIRESETICRKYFIDVCETPELYYKWYEVKKSVLQEISIPALVSKAVALKNAFSANELERTAYYVEQYIIKALDDLNILYEVPDNIDGFFVFPKGVQLLDENCVSTPYQWLQKFPQAQKAMRLAVTAYTNKEDPSNTADLFRKALETFAQEFLGSNKSLENLKSSFGAFMKSKGVPSELSSNIENLLQMYTNYMNSYAKHKDGTAEVFLEFIMYHTGNIIRFMLSLEGQDVS